MADPKKQDPKAQGDVPKDEQPVATIVGEQPIFRVNTPFFDGVQLHPVNTEIVWVRPEGWPATAGKHFSENGPSVTFTPMNQSAKKILDMYIEKRNAQNAVAAMGGKGSDQTLALLAAIKELVAARK